MIITVFPNTSLPAKLQFVFLIVNWARSVGLIPDSNADLDWNLAAG